MEEEMLITHYVGLEAIALTIVSTKGNISPMGLVVSQVRGQEMLQLQCLHLGLKIPSHLQALLKGKFTKSLFVKGHSDDILSTVSSVF